MNLDYIKSTVRNRCEESKKLGSGFYSSVYEVDNNPEIVVKTNNGNEKIEEGFEEDGWVYYALKCIESNSSYCFMPEVYYLEIDFRSKRFWAVTEKLEERDECDSSSTRYKATGSLVRTHSWKENTGDLDKTTIYEFETFLNEVMDEMGGEFAFFLDAHNANWMERKDGRAILTDPFASQEDWAYEKTKKLLVEASKLFPHKVVICI